MGAVRGFPSAAHHLVGPRLRVLASAGGPGENVGAFPDKRSVPRRMPRWGGRNAAAACFRLEGCDPDLPLPLSQSGPNKSARIISVVQLLEMNPPWM